jgi:hypothetical protein
MKLSCALLFVKTKFILKSLTLTNSYIQKNRFIPVDLISPSSDLLVYYQRWRGVGTSVSVLGDSLSLFVFHDGDDLICAGVVYFLMPIGIGIRIRNQNGYIKNRILEEAHREEWEGS